MTTADVQTAGTSASDLAVDVSGLTKIYGKTRVVDGLDLKLRRSTVCGLVGPNGAGKTTALRMLLGLIRHDEGDGEVLGSRLDDHIGYLPRVGALIEGPAFTPSLSARRNLLVLTRIAGLPDSRADDVLGQVGLAGREGDKVKAYSLGMRQRLGIAAALLTQPELLVLDEPTNGLDPAGIREIRDLLQQLAANGVSVLVSSHLLSEVEEMCHDLVLINKGRVGYSGTLSGLIDRQRTIVVARPADSAQLASLLRVAERFGDASAADDGTVRFEGEQDTAAQLNRAAFEAGVLLSGLGILRPTLEEAFFAMTDTGEGDDR
jgi:ABC-2 type transport system ATP-binding protein